MRRNRTLAFSFVLFAAAATAAAPGQGRGELYQLRYDVAYLASDALQGRAAGSQGGRLAAEFVAERFSQLGLEPEGDGGTFLQSFSFISGVSSGQGNRLTVDGESARPETDFRPLAFSASGEAEAEVVFAGYGIHAQDLGYDDYAGLDVKDKIVLLLRHSPDGDDPASRFQPYMPLRRKAAEARQQGAAAVLVATGPAGGESGAPVKIAFDASFGDAGLPVLSLATATAERLFSAQGFSLADLQRRIDERKEPASRPLGVRASLAADVIQEHAATANVLALLPGRDPELRSEVVVVGAHYDHLGWGGPDSGSLAPGVHAIHNGADDNASGVAGMLEVARRLAASPPARSVLFAAFAGEERGLLGSSHLVSHLPVPREAVVAMLNLDMIGRPRRHALTIGGYGTAAEWPELLSRAGAFRSFKVTTDAGGFGASDHSSFYGISVPVLFFFTGAHEDYHKPSDDVDRIDFPGLEKVAVLVADTARAVGDAPGRPTFQKVADEGAGARRSYKVRTGVIPEFGYAGPGFRISGVAGGSPAERGGLQGGDVVVRFGDREIRNIYDYMYALSDHEPGQTVEVEVVRDGRHHTFQVTLEAGRSRS